MRTSLLSLFAAIALLFSTSCGEASGATSQLDMAKKALDAIKTAVMGVKDDATAKTATDAIKTQGEKLTGAFAKLKSMDLGALKAGFDTFKGSLGGMQTTLMGALGKIKPEVAKPVMEAVKGLFAKLM